MTVHTLLSAIRELFQDTLSANLTGCYLHGSLALGCFQWRRSDVDFLAVVDEEPGPAQKESLISGLLGLEPLAPPKGMEMSLVCRDACLPFRYPTPYVLHYSRMHQAAARRDTAAYCEAMHGLDKDLAAHIAVIRQSGMVLCGAPIGEVFAEVPRSCYLDSVLADIGPDAALDQDPAYTLLNLCRTWRFLAQGQIASKRQGGQWALEQLPEPEAVCIRAALAYYAGADAAFPDNSVLQACARSLWTRIQAHLPEARP